MIPMQNLCGFPSLAFMTAANHCFLYSTDCTRLFLSITVFPRLPKPSATPYNRSSFSPKLHNKRLIERSLGVTSVSHSIDIQGR